MKNYNELKIKLDENVKLKNEYSTARSKAIGTVEALKSQAKKLKEEMDEDIKELRNSLIELEYLEEGEEMSIDVLKGILDDIEEDLDIQNDEYKTLIKELRKIND